MHFGLRYCNIGPLSRREPALELARFAEDAGFESIWTIEHVVIPVGYQSKYPYSEDGRFGWPETLDYPDPLMWLATVAGATETLKLGTAVMILPQRNPVVLAKELATLDSMSGGRALFGVGIGWLEEEFEAIGVPFRERAPRTDETIEALRCLWREPEATFDGRFFSFDQAVMEPKPVQEGGVPILIGGDSQPAARRAGRLGDGYFPARATPESLPPLLETMRATATEHGRDPDSIELTAGSVFDLDTARAFEAQGADRLMCALMLPSLVTDIDEAKRKIDSFVADIMSKF